MLAIVEYAIILCLPDGTKAKKRRLEDEGKKPTVVNALTSKTSTIHNNVDVFYDIRN